MSTLDRHAGSRLTRERLTISLLVGLLFVLWAGFLLHRSSRFAGSGLGGAIAIAGSVLIVVPTLAYTLVKHIPALRRKLDTAYSISQILSWHVYTSVAGAILAIVHTGHRYESDIGIALTAIMLAAVLTGYVGRHLLLLVMTNLREKQRELSVLQSKFNVAVASIDGGASDQNVMTSVAAQGKSSAAEVPALAESIAELEFTVRSHNRLKQWARGWLTLHILLAVAFAIVLAGHIWTGIYFGLRWFE